MQRPFASGSKQAPDPCDQYLEQEGFYRKHTARDTSCLFRTISEQMYDTQLHHLSIRQMIVDYMRKYKTIFQKSIVDMDIDEYLDEMSKPKTHGSLLELQAAGYFYRHNVILFEEYNTGSWMINEPDFVEVFRIFYNQDKHFDSVYTKEMIETAAFCQSITYEILYKNVFKLPDVRYAVERMLHGSSFEDVHMELEYDGSYAKRMIMDDGREFLFDRPENTCCILENYNLCHFHNPNYTQFTDALQQDICLMDSSQCESHKAVRIIEGVLPDKYISCVRQLLDDGITPFPYKVAKALDPDIYRNIEFDAWSEVRKEQRFKGWYTGGNNFQVGVKCLVRLHNSQSDDLYTCHIQDMSSNKGPCLVFVEELGEKHMVPYESLQPLPSGQAKPWPLPFRYQRLMERQMRYINNDFKRNTKYMNVKNKMQILQPNFDIVSIKEEMFSGDEIMSEKDDIVSKLKELTSLQHFQPMPADIIAMPLNVEHKNIENSKNSRRDNDNQRTTNNKSDNDCQKQDSNRGDDVRDDIENQPSDSYSYGYGYSEPYSFPYDSSIIHAGSHNFVSGSPQYYCMLNPNIPSANGSIPPSMYLPPPPLPCNQRSSNLTSYYQMNSGLSISSGGSVTTFSNRRNNLNPLPNRMVPKRSTQISGSDLPSDIAILRFFYNLGCDYYVQLYGLPAGESTNDNNERHDVNKLATELKAAVKIENENNNLVATSQSQSTADSNNNITTNTTANQNSRRFHSRYFNRKDRTSFRGGHNNRYSYNNKSMNAKNNQNSNNNTVNNKHLQSEPSPDQCIQTSPVSTATGPIDAVEYIQTPPLYSVTHASSNYAPYIPVYSSDGEPQSGIIMPPQQIMPVPYGIYPSTHPHGTSYQAYVAPPPPPAHQPLTLSAATYAPHPQTSYYQGVDTPSIIGPDGIENGHIVMGYTPLYYSPNGTSPPSAPVQQAYWYTPAPPPVPPPPPAVPIAPTQVSGQANTSLNVSGNSNNNVSH